MNIIRITTVGAVVTNIQGFTGHISLNRQIGGALSIVMHQIQNYTAGSVSFPVGQIPTYMGRVILPLN